MRVVPKLEFYPSHCVVFPQISHDPDGFVDTGNTLPYVEPRVGISLTACRALGEKAGMVSGDVHQKALDEVERLSDELALAHAELAETQAFQDAIDVIESKEFRARRKPGPKRPKPAAKAA